MNPSGTKCKVVIPRWSREVDMTFDDKGSGVTIQVMGAEEPVRGIWAIDNTMNTLVIQSPTKYGWWNSVYTFTLNGNSGNGFYMLYTQHLNLSDLEPCTIAQTS
jgi:hypothetical protein